MKRLEIWSADLSRIDGSHVQQGFRPILIISNERAAICHALAVQFDMAA